jgi:poly(3-hydroxybutyrate) depolymerase
MTMRRGSCLSLLAAGALLTVASCGGSSGDPVTGTAGSNGGQGTAGNTGAGTAGANSSGSAGDIGGGSAGDQGTGSAGATQTGSAGATQTGTAGATQTGSAGATQTGTAGADGGTTTGTGGSSTAGLASGMSAGCGQAPPTSDKSGSYVKHMIAVTGIASTVKPATAGGSWTNRTYYLDLPGGYDGTKPFPVIFGGGGCGGDLSNGNNGGFGVLSNGNTSAIQIGLSYVWPQGGGACFDDDGADTPDLPYFDAIMKEIEANYCIDKSKVFVGGYSSGGWEAYLLGLARGGSVVRGISTAAGGLRMNRPTPSGLPITALLLTGASDTTNPATGPTGSDLAVSLILQTNKCQGTATMPWATSCPSCGCNVYTGCPADAQVVRCRSTLNGHTDGGGDFKTAIWKTWMALPSR